MIIVLIQISIDPIPKKVSSSSEVKEVKNPEKSNQAEVNQNIQIQGKIQQNEPQKNNELVILNNPPNSLKQEIQNKSFNGSVENPINKDIPDVNLKRKVHQKKVANSIIHKLEEKARINGKLKNNGNFNQIETSNVYLISNPS